MSNRNNLFATEYPGDVPEHIIDRRLTQREKNSKRRKLKTTVAVLGAAAIAVGVSNIVKDADSRGGRAIPTHTVKQENAGGVAGGTYTGEQGNAPAESNDSP